MNSSFLIGWPTFAYTYDVFLIHDCYKLHPCPYSLFLAREVGAVKGSSGYLIIIYTLFVVPIYSLDDQRTTNFVSNLFSQIQIYLSLC